jgi:UDP-N-acetylglucosamine 1-carboxyvinyltransferase
MYQAKTDGLVGAHYRFRKNTHTGTETLLMAAVKARGTTILENAAQEPEIDDLIDFLNAMGGKITRRADRTIEIIGVSRLHGAIHRILPDRNEAVSYACAALATGGDVIIENARQEHLTSFLDKLSEIGGGYECGNYGIRFYAKGPLTATDVTTQVHPGFMTDWQPLWATLSTQAEGVSTIHETIMDSRFQYVTDLQNMGVRCELYSPEVANPETTYNFDLTENTVKTQHAVRIYGKTALTPGEFYVKDLRHGATLILASLIAKGHSIIHDVELVDRGYESLDSRLRSIGAHIKRGE